MKVCVKGALLAILAASSALQPAFAQRSSDEQSPVAPAAATRPHVIVWMLDDIGFAQLSCFGGLVRTPNIDRVANQGLRYTNYRTAPICSASRAALLTGRNPHSVHMGGHAGAPLPYPGYDGVVPASAGTIAANLKAAGYQTIALGKWDHLPSADMTPAGPFTLWPTGQGFDRFYGFLGADADNWQPVLIDGTAPINTPSAPGYHLNDDLADRAIAAFDARSARRDAAPVFMYLATGTAHAPHHAPQAWIDHYKGQFDMGWDKARETILERQIAMGILPAGAKLAPRPEGMPAWSSLTAEDRQLYARQMEVFAAAVSHADEQFGRVLDALEAKGELDNTIIVITSDNGASAEGAFHGTHNETLFMNGYYPSAQENMAFIDQWGGPETQPHYAFGWAVAGNTPFRYFKQTTHDGGIRVPLVVSWPRALPARGELRSEFAYVADVAPTILDLAEVPQAATLNNVAQSPMEGLSLKARLLSSSAPIPSRAQYFEMYGNKGLWQDGWTIVTSHRLDPWRMDQLNPINEPWELYNSQADPGQTRNLASQNPDKVKQLAALFDAQASRFNVNPISNFGDSRAFGARAFMAEMAARKGLWSFDRPVSNIGFGAAPPVALRPFDMRARLDLQTGAESGPIFAFGGSSGGMSAYLKNGIVGFAFRDLSGKLSVVEAPTALPSGPVTVTVRIERPIPQPMRSETVTVTLLADEKVLVQQSVTTAIPATYGVAETFDIGVDRGSAVSPAYRPDQPFSGKLGKVSFQFR
jgi:arylsulfatase A-like enzyme